MAQSVLLSKQQTLCCFIELLLIDCLLNSLEIVKGFWCIFSMNQNIQIKRRHCSIYLLFIYVDGNSLDVICIRLRFFFSESKQTNWAICINLNTMQTVRISLDKNHKININIICIYVYPFEVGKKCVRS